MIGNRARGQTSDGASIRYTTKVAKRRVEEISVPQNDVTNHGQTNKKRAGRCSGFVLQRPAKAETRQRSTYIGSSPTPWFRARPNRSTRFSCCAAPAKRSRQERERTMMRGDLQTTCRPSLSGAWILDGTRSVFPRETLQESGAAIFFRPSLALEGSIFVCCRGKANRRCQVERQEGTRLRIV